VVILLPSITVCPAVDKFENDTTSVNVAELPGRKTGVPPLLPGVLSVTLKPIPNTYHQRQQLVGIVDQLADKPINPNDKKVYVLALE
jgi:hypothetical protein